MRKYTDWRQCLSYPQHVGMSCAVMLDVLNEVQPIVEVESYNGDRYTVLAKWLEQAKVSGLLVFSEYSWARGILAQQI